MNKPVLSICIPTYNRADVLKHCLDAIVNHEISKTGNLEIVVCDNASTDDTQTLMQTYQNEYAFVKYFRNEENIGVIYNTIKVLDCATGQYRKLLNDYSVFTRNGLQKMYEQVVANLINRPVLVFNNNVESIKEEHTCVNLEGIAYQMGIWLTWMGVYGYWEEDWQNVTEKEKYYDKTFTTIDWLRQMLIQKKEVKVYLYHYTDGWPYQRKQGGYNFFKAFVQDYLDLWNMYKENGNISYALYRWIKKDTWSFVWEYTKSLLIHNNAGNFDTDKGWKILFKYYGTEWYFWWTLFKYPFGVIKRKIKKLL